MYTSAYEMVIGLEVHVELKTKSKIFCSCSTAFGAAPNTQCCPVCTGMPGTLPVLNEQVVRYAVLAGMATNCTIASFSKQDRKNYFYPDLPKAYQISQYDLPLCEHGYLDIEDEKGTKRIGITRIHIEEDAGKLVHVEGKGTLCDYNRCGVPLIEIVSEPDLRSAAQVKAYLQKLRAILLYVNVSDCKMNEGSLRCDVNLSVRKIGAKEFGTRTEMKNLNSFQFIGKAIEYEFKRQVEALENGESIVQETRRYDQASGKTYSMRKKEDANDYRYFPDPDLVPIVVSKELLNELRASIPTLPDARKKQYMKDYGLSSYDAERLVTEKEIADYFEAAAAHCKSPKLIANFLLGEIARLMPAESTVIPIAPQHMALVADMLESGRINNGSAKKLLSMLWQQDGDPESLVKEHRLEQISDRTALAEICTAVIAANEKSAADYKSGKAQALQALLGQAMGKTGGQANPTILRELMFELLK